MRHRTLFTIGGSIVVGAALFFSDPDHGISTALMLLGLAACVLAVTGAHWARKALFDYDAADMQELFKKSKESPEGSGLALIAQSIVIAALLLLAGRVVHADTLPAGALVYGPMLKTEQLNAWPDHPHPAVLAGLVEQESCISLTSRGCWNPAARLKTAREEGAGFGQITRAYTRTGGLRFDSLAAMRDKYDSLAGWSWDNVYQRPDLQLRAIVLMSRENYQAFRTTSPGDARLALADAAYNGGLGGVQAERRACGMSSGCDPDLWFDNVERHCLKSRAALYGLRSACDINRTHVKNVIRVRSAKYELMMAAL